MFTNLLRKLVMFTPMMLRPAGGFALVVALLTPSSVMAQRRGCWLGAGAGGIAGKPIFYPSGNPRMDMGFQQEGMALVQLFGIAPRFFYLDDRGSPNAYATPEVVNPMGPDGTILIGINLIQSEALRDNGIGFSLAAILAHEFTHLVQFKYGIGVNLPTKYRELHADFMAGWYMGLRERYLFTDVRPALQSFFEHGDYGFNRRDHHGTPEQRLLAVQSGYQSSELPLEEALWLGLEFVHKIG